MRPSLGLFQRVLPRRNFAIRIPQQRRLSSIVGDISKARKLTSDFGEFYERYKVTQLWFISYDSADGGYAPQEAIDIFKNNIKKELADKSPQKKAEILLNIFGYSFDLSLKKSLQDLIIVVSEIIFEQNLTKEIFDIYKSPSCPKELHVMHKIIVDYCSKKSSNIVLMGLLENVKDLGLATLADIPSLHYEDKTPFEILLRSQAYPDMVVGAAMKLYKFLQDPKNLKKYIEIIKERDDFFREKDFRYQISLPESLQNHLMEIIAKKDETEIRRAVFFNDKLGLETFLATNLEGRSKEQKANLLLKSLVETIDSELYLMHVVLRFIKNENLAEEIINICKSPTCQKELMLVHNLVDELSADNLEKLKIIFNEIPQFRSFVDLRSKSHDNQTPIMQLLRADISEKTLCGLWLMIPYSKDVKIIEELIEYTKQEKFSPKSILKVGNFEGGEELEKMSLQDLFKERLVTTKFEEEYGKKPKIVIPIYGGNNEWEKLPRQAFCDFGLNVESILVSDKYFLSAEKILELQKIIEQQMSLASGLVLVGNNHHVPSRIYNQEKSLDLKSVENRIAFIHAIALKVAVKKGLPIFAICYGAQLSLVLLGGALENVENQMTTYDYTPINIKPGSMLDFGDDFEKKIPAYSAHYQGVVSGLKNKFPKNMWPMEFSPQRPEIPAAFEMLDDKGGVIAKVDVAASSVDYPEVFKAYEVTIPDTKERILVATQFHPERGVRFDRVCYSILKEYTQKCFDYCAKQDEKKPPTILENVGRERVVKKMECGINRFKY